MAYTLIQGEKGSDDDEGIVDEATKISRMPNSFTVRLPHSLENKRNVSSLLPSS